MGALFTVPFAGILTAAYFSVKSTCDNVPQIKSAAQGAVKAHAIFPEMAKFGDDMTITGVGTLDIQVTGSVDIHDKPGAVLQKDFVVKLKCNPGAHTIEWIDDRLSDHAAVQPAQSTSGQRPN
ncbi:hypothetical protein [Chelatococcus reniformis]|nr:hypothetical protein [Chelatococcus reniformis]